MVRQHGHVEPLMPEENGEPAELTLGAAAKVVNEAQ